MNTYKDQCLKNIIELVSLVQQEGHKQKSKWGIQVRTAFEWMNYLTEEVGELAEAVSEYEYQRNPVRQNIVKEAIQVATLSLKIAEMFSGG